MTSLPASDASGRPRCFHLLLFFTNSCLHTRKACIGLLWEIFYVAILFDILSIKGTSLLNGKCRACVEVTVMITLKWHLNIIWKKALIASLPIFSGWWNCEIFGKFSIFYDYFYNLKILSGDNFIEIPQFPIDYSHGRVRSSPVKSLSFTHVFLASTVSF